MLGTVHFYSRLKGWGFAVPDDDTADVFLHFRQLVDCRFLRKNDRIQFELGEYNGRVIAVNIRVIEAAPVSEGGGNGQQA